MAVREQHQRRIPMAVPPCSHRSRYQFFHFVRGQVVASSTDFPFFSVWTLRGLHPECHGVAHRYLLHFPVFAQRSESITIRSCGCIDRPNKSYLKRPVQLERRPAPVSHHRICQHLPSEAYTQNQSAATPVFEGLALSQIAVVAAPGLRASWPTKRRCSPAQGRDDAATSLLK